MRKTQLSTLAAYGIVVFSVITAVSLLFSIIDLKSILEIDVNFTLIAFVSFILFVVVVGIRFRELSSGSRGNYNTQSQISIKPITEKDNFYLEVTNIGEIAATFVARLKITSKQNKEVISPELTEYSGSWRLSNTRETKILKGQSDKIRIAELQTTNFPIVAIHLRAYVYQSEYKITKEIALQSYFPLAVVTHADGKSGPMERPVYDLEVSISSDPSMKECPLHKKYMLSISGLEEIATPSS
jgi:hypothetical protein